MDALVLLGIIPGTSFQIDFNDWVLGMVVLCGLLLALAIFRNRYKIEFMLFFLTLRWRKPTKAMPRLA